MFPPELESALQAVIGTTEGLPLFEPLKPSIFDIAGFPRREVVNSRLLAYYFDREESHGFEEKCLEALLEALKGEYGLNLEKIELKKSYSVATEWHKIDVVILGKKHHGVHEWAILIENKIGHTLNNPLDDYWKRVKADFKIGIVLAPTLKEIPGLMDSEAQYYPLTHLQLKDSIEKKLGAYDPESTTHSRAILEDFLNHLKNISMDTINRETLKEKALDFFKRHEELKKIEEYINNIRGANFCELLDFMRPYGFEISGWFNPSKRDLHFYYNPNEERDKAYPNLPTAFRFWFNQPLYLGQGSLECIFELYGEEATAKNVERIKESISEFVHLHHPNLSLGSDTQPGNYAQIIYLGMPLEEINKTSGGNGYHEKLKAILKEAFFTVPEGGTHHLVGLCAAALEHVWR